MAKKNDMPAQGGAAKAHIMPTTKGGTSPSQTTTPGLGNTTKPIHKPGRSGGAKKPR